MFVALLLVLPICRFDYSTSQNVIIRRLGFLEMTGANKGLVDYASHFKVNVQKFVYCLIIQGESYCNRLLRLMLSATLI